MSEYLDPAIEFNNPLMHTRSNERWLKRTANDAKRPDIGASVVVFASEGELRTQSLVDDSEISPEDLQAIRQQHSYLR